MALPADVTYGTVRGCLTTNGLSDTPGLGAPLGGYVSFDPIPSYLLHDDGETVIRMRTRIVPLNPADGTFVVDDLIATDCPVLTPTDWTYRVSFAGADRSLRPFFINLAGGSDVGIASVTPVASSSGDVTPNAIQAIAIDSSAHLITTMSDGSTIDAGNILTATGEQGILPLLLTEGDPLPTDVPLPALLVWKPVTP